MAVIDVSKDPHVMRAWDIYTHLAKVRDDLADEHRRAETLAAKAAQVHLEAMAQAQERAQEVV